MGVFSERKQRVPLRTIIKLQTIMLENDKKQMNSRTFEAYQG